MNQTSLPPSLNGFGTIVATTAAALSTVTKGTNSNAYPTGTFPNNAVTITNTGTGTIVFYPFGGSTVGITIPLNTPRTFNLGGVDPATPQIASGTTATAVIEW